MRAPISQLAGTLLLVGSAAAAQTSPAPSPAPMPLPTPAQALPGNASPPADAFAYPSLPDVPKLAISAYPSCQNQWQSATNRLAKFSLAQSCVNELERYNIFNLKRFTADVAQYSLKLVLIEQQFSRSTAPQANKQVFHDRVRERLARVHAWGGRADDQDYGDDYRDYYQFLQRYQDDMKVLMPVRDACRDSGGTC